MSSPPFTDGLTLEVRHAGKAVGSEDRYASTGGQLHELVVGHDHFDAHQLVLLLLLAVSRGAARRRRSAAAHTTWAPRSARASPA